MDTFNQRQEHAPSPAGACADTPETVEATENPNNEAAGDGCVSRLVGCSSFREMLARWRHQARVAWINADATEKESGGDVKELIGARLLRHGATVRLNCIKEVEALIALDPAASDTQEAAKRSMLLSE